MIRTTLLALVLFAGCSQDQLLQNASPAYAAGYRDGCQNGTSTASNKTGAFVRDERGVRIARSEEAD